MVSTQVIRATHSMSRSRSMARPGYEANTLAVVIDSPTRLGPLRDDLTSAGIEADRVDVLPGMETEPDAGGLIASLRRRAHDAGLIEEPGCHYSRDPTVGRLLIVIRDIPRSAACELRGVLLSHGCHNMRHFGRFSTALIAP